MVRGRRTISHPADSAYTIGLERNDANHAALTPLSFLQRTAAIYPERLAVIHGAERFTYAQLYKRCLRLASALERVGIVAGDTVAIMAPNIPPMLEAHHGVPMAGAVLNALNYRLDAKTIAYILDHGGAKLLITDTEYAPVIAEALKLCARPPIVIDIVDVAKGERLGQTDYEEFLQTGDPGFEPYWPADEWQAIGLNYTSGTTGNPKGVVYHHRGAYLNAIGNVLVWQMAHFPVYLWTLPMFHCNGWCFPWTICLQAGVHVCLRRVDGASIFEALAEHDVSHLCGAPIIMSMLINAEGVEVRPFAQKVRMMTAASAPPAAVLERMEALGIEVTHVYGLTEVYGPATVCATHPEWAAFEPAARSALMARQGVAYPVLEGLSVRDPHTMEAVPRDAETIGEIMMRGHDVMKGYLKNQTATQEAFAGGWFHTGDLGVWHPDGYVEIKDRSKDIIISGGENISSIEIEGALFRHPEVLDAAVVARTDEVWGETPCAFVTLKTGSAVSVQDLQLHCRQLLAGFKVPKTFVFGPLPKTSTGKIQKFQLRSQANRL